LTRRRPFSRVVTSDASTTRPRREWFLTNANAFAGGSTISGGPPANDGGAHALQRAPRTSRPKCFVSSSFSSSVPFNFVDNALLFVSTQRHAATPPSSCTATSAERRFFCIGGELLSARGDEDDARHGGRAVERQQRGCLETLGFEVGMRPTRL
jgi:hypothetical protein